MFTMSRRKNALTHLVGFATIYNCEAPWARIRLDDEDGENAMPKWRLKNMTPEEFIEGVRYSENQIF